MLFISVLIVLVVMATNTWMHEGSRYKVQKALRAIGSVPEERRVILQTWLLGGSTPVIATLSNNGGYGVRFEMLGSIMRVEGLNAEQRLALEQAWHPWRRAYYPDTIRTPLCIRAHDYWFNLSLLWKPDRAQ